MQSTILQAENIELKAKVTHLDAANTLKKYILATAVVMETLSLALAIWGTVDSTQIGLSEAGIAVSTIGLCFGLYGLFKHSACCVPKVAPAVEQKSRDTEGTLSSEMV